MKSLLYLTIFAGVVLGGCKKTIDLYPVSNLNTGTYYSNLEEVRAGLTGVYNGLQTPLLNEWALTELRSDNSKQGQTGSTSTSNVQLNQLDMFTVPAYENRIYDYWLATYNNIRNANIILQKLGVVYNPATGVTTLNNISIPLTDADRKQFAGEALFIRAYHYYNLVRLFGGVFVIHTPIGPDEAKLVDRSSVADTYKFIQADLQAAAANMNTLKYNQLQPADVGRVTGWSAKALLAKVYLNLNKKAEALSLLNDVRLNSGYGLVSNFNNVFATSNEANAEMLFVIRFKGGGLGLGSRFANLFGPLNTGTAVVPGDGQGLNYPTADLDSTIATNDQRKPITVARYVAGTLVRSYTRKYIVTTVSNDGESDWPVLRYADVLLMIAEAQGNSQNSVDMINLVRTRAGVTPINYTGITSTKLFEDTLSNERRIEFAFENQRWFDLLRYNVTMTTVTAEATMKAHFEKEYPVHYKNYPLPTPTLAELQANVTRDKLLLPIPQKEFDTNPRLNGQQNPGY
jgi:starch-binding outer membrane protein, SusD/RagB family